MKDADPRKALILAPKPTIPVTLTPITPHKDVVVSTSNESVQIRGEDVPKTGDVLKTLIPLTPKPTWPNWSLDYLHAVITSRTDGEAARKIGLSYQTVYEARLSLADFATAWDACRRYRNSRIVSDLEDKSLERALKCSPDDRMSASLNMFHLKARNDMYKDKAASLVGGITINLGYQILDTKRNVGPVSDAEFE